MKGEENNRDQKWVEMTRKEILEEKKIGGTGIRLDFELTDLEKSLIKDPVLDTCSSLEFAVNLVKIMREINNGSEYYNYSPSSFLSGLKRFSEAPPNSDYWKCVQAAKNNGDLLTKAINLVHPKYLAKSQGLKGSVVNELNQWVLTSLGFESIKPRPQDQKVVWEVYKEALTPEHYQEVRKLLIESIKQNPQEWKYQKKVGWLDEKTGDEWYVSWVLENTKNPRRCHEVSRFTAKEREEIEKALKITLSKPNWELEAEEAKERVLKDPQKWILGPNGQIITMESLWGHSYDNRRVFSYNDIFRTNGLKRKENPLGFDELNPKQFGEIQQVFLKEIESNPSDWKIEQEPENELWVIKHKSGRRHYKNISLKGERDEWWEEVEKVLTNKLGKNETSQNSKPTTTNDFPARILIVGGISLISLVLIALLIKKRRGRSKLKK